MSVLSGILQRTGLWKTSGFWSKWLGGTISKTGQTISAATAPKVSTVYACVNLISNHISTVPLYIQRRTDEGIEHTNHPLQMLLRHQPDVYLNGQQWRYVMMQNILLKGNAFFIIHKGGNGMVTRLQYVPMEKVQILQDEETKQVKYQISDTRLVRKYDYHEVLHFKAWTLDGVWGETPISYAANMIGVGLSATETISGFYKNGAVPSGILQLKGTIRDPERLKELGKQFDQNYAANTGSSGTAVLTEGAEYNPLQINQRDSQFIETLNFTVEDIARFFQVPLNKLSTSEAASQGAGIEAEDHAFIQDCLRPWVENIEAELQNKLVPQHSSFIVQLDLGELQRGSVEDRVQWAVSLANIGVVSKNEIRKRFGLNSVPEGDKLIEPAMYAPRGDIEEGTKNKKDEQQQP